MVNPVKKPKWWDEFIAFAVKGNAMALAVGTIIGAAFSTITKSLTDDIIMPIVAIFMGGIDFSELKIVLPPSIAPFLVPKGSICVNGVSLTLSALSAESFAVRIIPTTWNETNLRFLKSGSSVNLEADLLGKYVRFQLEAMLGRSAGNGGSSRDHSSGHPSLPHSSSLSMDDLKKAGFLE